MINIAIFTLAPFPMHRFVIWCQMQYSLSLPTLSYIYEYGYVVSSFRQLQNLHEFKNKRYF